MNESREEKLKKEKGRKGQYIFDWGGREWAQEKEGRLWDIKENDGRKEARNKV